MTISSSFYVGRVLSVTLAWVCVAACTSSGSESPGGRDGDGGASGVAVPTPIGDEPGEAQDGATSTASWDGGSPRCGGKTLPQWESMMLAKHNEWRASVSPRAAGMNRVHWDTAIAANAAAWVESCDPEWPHSSEDKRKGVAGYESLGENLSYCAGSACAPIPGVNDGSGLGDGEGWWDERNDYDYATGKSRGVTSHYTQMVSANVYAIGCATKRCGAPGPSGWNGTWWWTICQYGPRGQAYFSGTKPYSEGAGGLVEPPPVVYERHPALCR